MRAYEYRHTVCFEETNLFGNVYFVNHLRWQGCCRERFLREHAPEILSQLEEGLVLATTRCSCEYLAEVAPFDMVIVRMYAGTVTQNRITLLFEYWRCRLGQEDQEELVARGEQQIASMRRTEEGLLPAPLPDALKRALLSYRTYESSAKETDV